VLLNDGITKFGGPVVLGGKDFCDDVTGAVVGVVDFARVGSDWEDSRRLLARASGSRDSGRNFLDR